MTIAVSLKVHDGLVLAADSAQTMLAVDPATRSQQVVNVYNNANKVFNLVKGRPIGGITWGAGNIGQASISTLVKDLRLRFMGLDTNRSDWRLLDSYTLQEVAAQTREFLYEEHYQPTFDGAPSRPPLGFLVAGYSAGSDLAEEWLISIDEQGQCPEPILLNQGTVGLNWFGDPEAITRLLLGYGSGLPMVLKDAGLNDDQISTVLLKARQMLPAYLYDAAMPIQDAIDLVVSLVETTIQFSRFRPGAATVGGPVEVAAVTKHEHFKWVRRKFYYDPALNPEGA